MFVKCLHDKLRVDVYLKRTIDNKVCQRDMYSFKDSNTTKNYCRNSDTRQYQTLLL